MDMKSRSAVGKREACGRRKALDSTAGAASVKTGRRRGLDLDVGSFSQRSRRMWPTAAVGIGESAPSMSTRSTRRDHFPNR